MSLALKQARVAPQISAGFLGSLGRFVKRGFGAAIGTLPIVGPAITVAQKIAQRKQRPTPPGQPVPLQLPQGVPVPAPGFNGGPAATNQRVFTGAAGAGVAVGTTIACPSGFRPNKSSYFTLAGFVPKGTRCVRRRRRNPMNPRALDRAISRVDSGKRLQSKLAEITTAKFTSSGKRKDCP